MVISATRPDGVTVKSIFSPSFIAAVAVNGCPNVKSRVSSATAPNGSLTLHVAVDEVVPEGEVTNKFPVSSCLEVQPFSVNAQLSVQPFESVAQSDNSSAVTVRYSVPVINGTIELLFGLALVQTGISFDSGSVVVKSMNKFLPTGQSALS